MKIQSIKGMYDLLPNQTKNWRQIENILHNFFSVHGYGEIRTPNIEQTKLFLDNKKIKSKNFTKQIAFNVIPHIDVFADDGYTNEELKRAINTMEIILNVLNYQFLDQSQSHQYHFA